MVKIAVDAMGGDNAPGEIVAGAVMAAQSEGRYSDFPDRQGRSRIRRIKKAYI